MKAQFSEQRKVASKRRPLVNGFSGVFIELEVKRG
jgi:hypothetical protein